MPELGHSHNISITPVSRLKSHYMNQHVQIPNGIMTRSQAHTVPHKHTHTHTQLQKCSHCSHTVQIELTVLCTHTTHTLSSEQITAVTSSQQPNQDTRWDSHPFPFGPSTGHLNSRTQHETVSTTTHLSHLQIMKRQADQLTDQPLAHKEHLLQLYREAYRDLHPNIRAQLQTKNITDDHTGSDLLCEYTDHRPTFLDTTAQRAAQAVPEGQRPQKTGTILDPTSDSTSDRRTRTRHMHCRPPHNGTPLPQTEQRDNGGLHHLTNNSHRTMAPLDTTQHPRPPRCPKHETDRGRSETTMDPTIHHHAHPIP